MRGKVAYPGHRSGWYHENIWWGAAVDLVNESFRWLGNARPGTIGLMFTMAYESAER